MGENLHSFNEENSSRQFNIDKPSHTEENLMKELLSKEDKIHYDFEKLKELTGYSDIGSHQLTSLVEQYTERQANSARLYNEELSLLCKQRQEIEQTKEEILQEHHFMEKNRISISDEGYNIRSAPTLEGFDVTGEYGTECYWRERATELQENVTKLGNLLDESLKRESALIRKLQESEKMEGRDLPVNELSRILERADNFLHFVLQNAPVLLAHQDKDLRYRFVYNHFPSLREEDIIGKTDDEILTGSEGVKELQDFKREVMENGKAAKREITFETPLFGKKTFLAYVEPVFDKEREVIGVNVVWFDVTDQVLKREKILKYREEMAVQKAKETELFKTMHDTEHRLKVKFMDPRDK